MTVDKTYILECAWAWDHSHREYATLCLEEYEAEISFEEILSDSVNEDRKAFLLESLNDIFEAQIPTHGSYKKVRVYRVLDSSFSNKQTKDGLVSDLRFVLKPLFDFDINGEPVPCSSD